jgi:hypothetical protein
MSVSRPTLFLGYPSKTLYVPSPCMLHYQHFTTLSYMWRNYLQHIGRHPVVSKFTDVPYHTPQNYAPANFSGSSLLHIHLRKPCSTVHRFYPESWLQKKCLYSSRARFESRQAHRTFWPNIFAIFLSPFNEPPPNYIRVYDVNILCNSQQRKINHRCIQSSVLPCCDRIMPPRDQRLKRRFLDTQLYRDVVKVVHDKWQETQQEAS